jgi:4-hydroxy-3-polyprenylbenzoate decarboxylase
MRKYHRQGKACPVVAVVGVDPLLFFVSFAHISDPENTSEYDFAGWLRGSPVEVVRGMDGLPIPAYAEVAIEGQIPPDEFKEEALFGEWTGYGKSSPSNIIRVKRILHRNDPILTSQSPAAPSRPPAKGELVADPRVSGLLWDQMEKAGARGIKSVAVYMARFLQVISIKNSYAGHARQIGHLATQCHAGAFMGRFTIVVDEEIDPYNLDQVLWAFARYADPERAIDIVRYCWTDRMDCGVYPWDLKISRQPSAPVYNSRCVVDACRPIEWGPDYHRSVVYPRELQERIVKKWGEIVLKDPSTLAWLI